MSEILRASKRRAFATFQSNAVLPSDTDEWRLPEVFYADIAPLPVSFAEYSLRRFRKRHTQETRERVLELFLAEVLSARETAFEVMDDFVRNRHAPIAPELRLSTEWLTRTLAAYDPLGTMPSATYKNWQKRGIIRMESHGKPVPANAAAVLMIRMMDRLKENIFPEVLSASEPHYWCHVVETPSSPPEVIPLDLLSALPPSAVVWTWPGAAWEDRWHLIGQNEANLGAIRFAGTKLVKGELWWDVDLQDLQRWDHRCASLYISLPGNHERQVEDLANVVLHRLFAEKKPIWEKEQKNINQHARFRTTKTLQSMFDKTRCERQEKQ